MEDMVRFRQLALILPLIFASAVSFASPSHWQYHEETDQMRGTKVVTAYVASDNKVSFAFPYDGGSRARLVLRIKDQQVDLMLEIDRGQFVCSASGDDTVAMKFDSGPVVEAACSPPDDGSSTTIFIEGDFGAQIQQSSHVVIEAEFFQEGTRQFTFTTSGLVGRNL